jgi:NAD(P)-dependent dehydrogenase (short-subunit alcohol dehydrogenase family)
MAKSDAINLDGQVVIVTGSGNGIGRGIAYAMADAGAHVVVSDIRADDAARTAAEMTQRGGSAASIGADVGVVEEAEALVAFAISTFGRLDVLCNNAGVSAAMVRLHEIEPEDFDHVTNVNLRGTYLCSKFAIPHFIANHKGVIINTSSAYGQVCAPKAAPYCATKAAINQLTRQMALDYGSDGIRVNAISPGYVDVGLGVRALARTAEANAAATAVREKAAQRQALGRQAQPSEIASVAVFLASEGASFMTGSIVNVDGGETLAFNYGDASN